MNLFHDLVEKNALVLMRMVHLGYRQMNRDKYMNMKQVFLPYRAEHVGSFLRPAELLDARARFAQGQLSADALRQVENDAIAEVIRQQESAGIQSITDGEFRREYFHLDFLKHLEGVTVVGQIEANSHVKSAAISFAPPKLSVTGPLRHVKPIEVENFQFIQSHVQGNGTVKITIPSPTMVHFRGGRSAIDIDAYPDLDNFFADLAHCYQDELSALYAAGCRYVQLDDTNLAYLCDTRMRDAARQRGEDPDALPRQYAALINESIRGLPDDMMTGIHLCRGNFRSNGFAEGGYEPVAEVLFNELNIDAYFLEYDDERSGDFKPLRFVPDDKHIVLGLISSKLGALESKEQIKHRIDEAAQYVPLERLYLSPQCGFSSTVHGNDISPRQQWDKLRLVKEIADEVWGR
jgi:5-methyltetrahydropteroyltriglutamate--homocysteine methyltransferase